MDAVGTGKEDVSAKEVDAAERDVDGSDEVGEMGEAMDANPRGLDDGEHYAEEEHEALFRGCEAAQ